MQRGRINSGFSRRFGADLAAFSVALLGASAPTAAGIVEDIIIDRQPALTGGFASDTEFTGGIVPWQRVADDFMLAETADILQVNWWGFYGENVVPVSETMRVRFYGARPTDDLPDDNNIIFEESFSNPTRALTGGFIFSEGADEYFYEVDLSTPAELEGNTLYWLEVVQIGDPDSRFRWEFSGPGPLGIAVINPALMDWQEVTDGADNAFQLVAIPEPSTIALVLFGGVLATRRGGGRRRPD